MRPNIILLSLIIVSCNQASGEPKLVDVETEAAPAVDPPSVVTSIEQQGGITAAEVENLPAADMELDRVATEPAPAPPPPKIEATPLKALTKQEAFELADMGDDVDKLVAVQRKAHRAWLQKSRETAALQKALEARAAMIKKLATERKRKPECLIVVMGKQVDDVQARAEKCGSAQWIIDQAGNAAGRK